MDFFSPQLSIEIESLEPVAEKFYWQSDQVNFEREKENARPGIEPEGGGAS